MLIKDFKKDFINMDVAQFTVAIVLDYEGEHRAAEAMMYFYNRSDDKYKYFKKNDSQESRVCVRDNLYNKLLLESKKRKISFLMIFLAYLYGNDVIKAPSNHRTYNDYKFYTLNSLSKNITLEKLYSSCMRLLFKVRPDELITCYMKTSMFRKAFMRFLQKKYKYDNFGKLNQFDESTVDSLISVVTKRIYRDSRNAYHIGSMTPNHFIIHALDQYFKDSASKYGSEDSEVTMFFKILNSRGQDREISGEDSDSGTTALAFEGITVKKRNEKFDFISVATRICEASLVVFNYKSKNTAYYDLFSKHRDDILDATAKERKNLLYSVLGCRFSLHSDVDSISFSHGDINTLRQKFKKRKGYIDRLDCILTNGTSINDLYGLYRDQFVYQSNLTNRDGIILYKGLNSSKSSETHGEIFKTLYNGMVALREFLEFIDSEDNTYGITLNNFNTDIFRNLEFIRRFNSLEDYLLHGKAVKAIIDEANSRNTLLDDVNTNLYTNDEMYSLMTTNNAFLENPIFQNLRSVSFGYINNAIEKRKERDKIANLFATFENIKKTYSNRIIFNYNKSYYSKKGLEGLYVDIFTIMCQVNDILKCDSLDRSKYRKFFLLVQLIAVAADMEGTPFIDSDGFYSVPYGNVTNEQVFSNIISYDEFEVKDDKHESAFKGNSGFRISFLIEIFNKILPQYKDTIVVSEKIRILLVVNQMINNLENYLNILYGTIERNKTDISLLCIEISRFIDLLDITLPISKVSTLLRLRDSKITFKLNTVISKKAKLDSIKDKISLQIVNKYLELWDEEFILLDSLHSSIFNTFKLTSSSPVSYKLDSLLEQANNNIIAITNYQFRKDNIEFDDHMSLQLQKYNHDNFGILTISNKRFVLEDGISYLHYKGFVITIDIMTESYDTRVLREEDLNSYLVQLEMTNARYN